MTSRGQLSISLQPISILCSTKGSLLVTFSTTSSSGCRNKNFHHRRRLFSRVLKLSTLRTGWENMCRFKWEEGRRATRLSSVSGSFESSDKPGSSVGLTLAKLKEDSKPNNERALRRWRNKSTVRAGLAGIALASFNSGFPSLEMFFENQCFFKLS